MVYQIKDAAWKNGVIAKTDAQTAARVMCELEAQNKLSAQGLVDASRPEDAPMHKDFEWDDAIAGEQWRKAQARVYIAGIVYAPVEAKGEQTRVFIKLTENKECYTALETVIRSQDSMEELKEQAKKELRAFKTKYETILQICEATSEINRLQTKLDMPIPKDYVQPQKRTTAQATA